MTQPDMTQPDMSVLMVMIASLQKTIELLTTRLEKYENVDKIRAQSQTVQPPPPPINQPLPVVPMPGGGLGVSWPSLPVHSFLNGAWLTENRTSTQYYKIACKRLFLK